MNRPKTDPKSSYWSFKGNIEAAPAASLTWNGTDVKESLNAIFYYVEAEAAKSLTWYWRGKRIKRFLSRWIQFLAVSLTVAGGMVPIVIQLWPRTPPINPLWTSLFVGIAAGLLALDKAFGFSTGWARYVVAATSIRRALEEFRMDWMLLESNFSIPSTTENLRILLTRAKDFRMAIEALVFRETQDWVTEFQSNMSQLERDVTAQVDKLKEQAEKVAAPPGAITVDLPNADTAAPGKVQVKLENAEGTVTDETLTGKKAWTRLNVPPGQYKISATGLVDGKLASADAVVVVKSGEILQKALTLSVLSG